MGKTIYDSIRDNGYNFEPIFDGEIHRFKPEGRSDKSGWFVGHKINISDKKDCMVMIYGDFSKNEQIEWKSSSRLSESEKIRRDAEVKKLKQKAEEERIKRQMDAAILAKQEWEKAEYINGKLPAYFQKKKITKNFGLKVKSNELMVPVFDGIDGNIVSYQTINYCGEKRFVKDGATKSNFFYIKGNNEKILICEGFATGATLHEATGFTVIVSFYASNMFHVCEKLLKSFDKDNLLICADNDHRGEKNTGILAANNISEKLGIKYVYPNFDNGSQSTDFNDLAIEQGLDSVKSIILKTTPIKSPLSGVTINNKGEPINNIDNVMIVLNNKFKDKIWYDSFKQRIYFLDDGKITEWSDYNDLKMTQKFQSEFGFNTITPDVIAKGCVLFAMENKRNKPKEWLNSLVWDKTERIQGFFYNYFGSSPDFYTQCASKNFWISLVARILNPGCKVDNMVILEGNQGKKKSTALSIIAGEEYFAEVAQDPSSKDFYSALQGKSLIEISELESFSKADVIVIKRVLSCRVDRYRASYDRHTKDYPRQCVFVGTTNESEYLRDATGNRRFWPIEITNIDIDLLIKDREQLYAEAVFLFKKGSTWWEMPEDETKKVTDKKMQYDEWHSAVEEYCLGKNNVTIKEIATVHLKIDQLRLDYKVTHRIARILKMIGYKSEVQKIDGKNKRIWSR